MSKGGNIYGTSDIEKQKKSAHRIHLTGVYICIRNFAVLWLRLALYLRQILFTDQKQIIKMGLREFSSSPLFL